MAVQTESAIIEDEIVSVAEDNSVIEQPIEIEEVNFEKPAISPEPVVQQIHLLEPAPGSSYVKSFHVIPTGSMVNFFKPQTLLVDELKTDEIAAEVLAPEVEEPIEEPELEPLRFEFNDQLTLSVADLPDNTDLIIIEGEELLPESNPVRNIDISDQGLLQSDKRKANIRRPDDILQTIKQYHNVRLDDAKRTLK